MTAEFAFPNQRQWIGARARGGITGPLVCVCPVPVIPNRWLGECSTCRRKPLTLIRESIERAKARG